ncbi:AAA family ATPase [Stenoxybacter acetivorans]|uniref:AAA family ATPase n=1 Tax=Stenoxybacter acetivorans TaxID=422441 RepID=UPI000689831D|nr:AAA family ATPase [Stenoxybacter acetivorans]
MMWIAAIELSNFRSYQQARLTFPRPEIGKNLVLIGAENGHGKTTLLEAIYLCLYGDDAVHHLNRAGLEMKGQDNKKINYTAYLEKALYLDARAVQPTALGLSNQSTMQLRIDICQQSTGNQKILRVKRKWAFDHNKKHLPNSEEIQAYFCENADDDGGEPLSEELFKHYLHTQAVPVDYASFFFFDGEKIVQNARASGAGKWLNDALHGLLGVTLLNKLSAQLGKYKSDLIRELAPEKLQKQLADTEAKLTDAKEKLTTYNSNLANLTEQEAQLIKRRDELTEQLGAGDIHTSKELIDQLTKIKQQQETDQEEIKKFIELLPETLLPTTRLTQLQQQLKAEANRLSYETVKGQLEPRADEFWKVFRNHENINEFLSPYMLSSAELSRIVKECWERMLLPLPEGCAETVSHNYLSAELNQRIQNEIHKLNHIQRIHSPETILSKIAEAEQNQEKLSAEIEQLKNSNNDELVEELHQINHELTQNITPQKTTAQNNSYRQNEEISSLARDLEKLQDQVVSSGPKQLRAKRAQKMESFIHALIHQLMVKKVQQLSITATRLNNEIAHDKRIGRIEVQDNGEMRLYGQNNERLQTDLSAGQMQILIMAVVAALSEITQYHAPLVIDTPLARLDKGHRQGLFHYWQGLNQQVILLSQDTEITPEIYQDLKPAINKTYLIKAESLASGGARSSAEENVYFKA